MDVTRAEFNRIIDILNERNVILNALREGRERLEHASEVQFHRIAQIQAELDEIKRAWQKMKLERFRLLCSEARLRFDGCNKSVSSPALCKVRFAASRRKLRRDMCGCPGT
jgi:hypothetical protein